MSNPADQNGRPQKNERVVKLLKEARTKVEDSIEERKTTEKYLKRALSRKPRSEPEPAPDEARS